MNLKRQIHIKPVDDLKRRIGKKRLRRIKRAFWLTFVALFLCLMTVLSHEADRDQQSLDKHGKPASGVVQQKRTSKTTKGATLSYDVQLRYTDATKLDHDAWIEVSKVDYEWLQPGYSYDITYDPDNGLIAKPQNYDINNWWWLGYLYIYAGVYLFIFAIGWIIKWRGRRKP
jgi:hypothetical protein